VVGLKKTFKPQHILLRKTSPYSLFTTTPVPNMTYHWRLVLISCFLALTSSSPVSITQFSSHDTNPVLSKRAWNADELDNEFKGIYWNHPLEDTDECTPEQIDKIVHATRATTWLTSRPLNDMGFEYSDAWTRYFKRYQLWIQSGKEYQETAANMIC